MTIHVLSVASEAYPLVKTGGLADVVGALPTALAPHGVEVTTLIPGYPAVMAALEDGKVLHHYDDLLGVSSRLVGGTAAGLKLIAVDAPSLYAREGGPYSDSDGLAWPDSWRRFAALGRVATDIATGTVADPRPDIVHAHDWQGALAAAYMHYRRAVTPSVVTIHNIAFPGRFPAEIFPFLGLPPEAYSIEGVEYYGGVGFLKAGLWAADAITTVSPTYAEQIREPTFGMGLEGLITARRGRVVGIVNGIDTTVWNPASDPNLVSSYDAKTLDKRAGNRREVQRAFRLVEDDAPIFCVVSRLTAQKGMDVLAKSVDALVAMGGRLALLGSGDAAIESQFTTAGLRHRGRVGVRISYDERLSHVLQGGADAILVPSRFEPCGLTQLYGLRYGCVPVAARTGGLADTIIDANEAALAAGAATGFLFDDVTPDGLVGALRRALGTYVHEQTWRSLQKQGMKSDVSWKRSGRRYADLYKDLLKLRNSGQFASNPSHA